MLIVYGSFRSLNIENNKKEKNGGVASADAVGGWFGISICYNKHFPTMHLSVISELPTTTVLF
jgi:hypothetical protein